MQTINIPIQTFCICNTRGEFKPLRFRYEDEGHQIQTIHINDILSVKEIQYAGVEAYIYTCTAVINDQEKMFELKYTINSHKWILFRMLT